MNQRRWAFALYYLCSAAVIAYLFRGDLPYNYRLSREGVQTQATVAETSCKSPTPIRYHYTVNGSRYEGSGEARFGNPPCEALKAGDQVTICYLPASPERSLPGNPTERFWTGVVGIAMAALFLPLVILFAFFLVMRRSGKGRARGM